MLASMSDVHSLIVGISSDGAIFSCPIPLRQLHLVNLNGGHRYCRLFPSKTAGCRPMSRGDLPKLLLAADLKGCGKNPTTPGVDIPRVVR